MVISRSPKLSCLDKFFHLLHVEFRFLSLDVSFIQLIISTRQFLKRSWRVTLIPNRSLDRYSAACYGEGNFQNRFGGIPH